MNTSLLQAQAVSYGIAGGPATVLTATPCNLDPALEASLRDGRRILLTASAILQQGEALLNTIPLEPYGRRIPVAFNASVGGHYRHCLDHFASLLRDMDSGTVNYDRRERDPRLESDPAFALAATQLLRCCLEALDPARLSMPLQARCEVSYAAGDAPASASTLGRELVYAIAHAIHHYALIGFMARLVEVPLPAHFGVAPSTLAHLASGAAK